MEAGRFEQFAVPVREAGIMSIDLLGIPAEWKSGLRRDEYIKKR